MDHKGAISFTCSIVVTIFRLEAKTRWARSIPKHFFFLAVCICAGSCFQCGYHRFSLYIALFQIRFALVFKPRPLHAKFYFSPFSGREQQSQLLCEEVNASCRSVVITALSSSSSSTTCPIGNRGLMMLGALAVHSDSVANSRGRRPLENETCPVLAIRCKGYTVRLLEVVLLRFFNI